MEAVDSGAGATVFVKGVGAWSAVVRGAPGGDDAVLPRTTAVEAGVAGEEIGGRL